MIPFHECWEWTGSGNGGYGTIRLPPPDGRYQKAHRISLLLHGIPLIPGLVVDHACRNKKCVNPKHLRQVSVAINTLENSGAASVFNKQKTHCPRGHEFRQYFSKCGKSHGRAAFYRTCRICATAASTRYREKRRQNLNEKSSSGAFSPNS